MAWHEYRIVIGNKSRYRKTLTQALAYAERKAVEAGRAEVYCGHRGAKWRRVKVVELGR
jgi:hypothetical protein